MMGLWLGGSLMVLAAWLFLALPLWQQSTTTTHKPYMSLTGLLVLLTITTALLYQHYGASQRLKDTLKLRQQVAELRTTLGTPTQVIARFERYLSQHPHDAQAWYLLGRLSLSQEYYTKAKSAFLHAEELQPNQPEVMIQLAQTLFFLNEQRLTRQAKRLIKQVLAQQPDHPLALNLLATDAYHRGYYRQALELWQKLLRYYPMNSTEHQALVAVIQRIQKTLTEGN